MSEVLKGQAIDLDVVQNFLGAEYQRWVADPSNGKFSFAYATKFLMQATDDLIVLVESQMLSGPDKKATVLAGVSDLFDQTVVPKMPGWMKPLSGVIKFFLIHLVINALIDYVVQKYNNGTAVATALMWKKTTR